MDRLHAAVCLTNHEMTFIFGLPDDAVLQANAQRIVADAHEISKKRGRNVLEILKTQAKDLKNSITDQEKKK